LKNGHDYAGDVLNVRAGFARNHLIPGKKALYATPQNFEKLGMADPDLVIETKEERSARLSREAADEEGGKEAKAADFIRYYLRNKTVSSYDLNCSNGLKSAYHTSLLN
jgi:ribosomal protein L9